jgi:hypothetical protein
MKRHNAILGLITGVCVSICTLRRLEGWREKRKRASTYSFVLDHSGTCEVNGAKRVHLSLSCFFYDRTIFLRYIDARPTLVAIVISFALHIDRP